MNILAIDPASRTGFAHTNGQRGVWQLGSGPGRLQRLDELISNSFLYWPIDVIAYESSTFGSRHAHVQRMHNELAGVIQLAATREQVQCWSYTPSQWKAIALGSGRADKQGVMRLLKLIYEIDVIDDDIADAVAILKCAERGPPPESKRKQRRAAEEMLKKAAKLF